jgi:cytochrome c oxidase subunit IV
MSEFHDYNPGYEFLAQHTPEEGKKKRKKLWQVFWILLVVTIAELIIGFYNHSFSPALLKVIFIGLTIFKAYFIVAEFMHLGHENKPLKFTIIVPYVVFIIYLVFICLTEGVYSEAFKTIIDPNVVQQAEELTKTVHH